MTNAHPGRHTGDEGGPADAPAGGSAQEEPPPLPTATLIEMIDVCHDEALRIESMQEFLVRGGSRREPDARMVRKMEIFQAAVRFLEACDRRPRALRAALAGPTER